MPHVQRCRNAVVVPEQLRKVITHRFKHNSRSRHGVYTCSRRVAKLWHRRSNLLEMRVLACVASLL